MIEGKVKVDQSIAAKAYKRAMWFDAVKSLTYFHGIRLAIVWFTITIVNGFFGQEFLNTYHGYTLFVILIGFVLYDYQQWSKKIDETRVEDYVAKLDELGVQIDREFVEERYDWDLYKNYEEYEDYIQINFVNGGMTIIPKTNELYEVIQFTKTKIPSVENTDKK